MSGLLSSNIEFVRFIPVFEGVVDSLSSLLGSITLYEYATIYLFYFCWAFGEFPLWGYYE